MHVLTLQMPRMPPIRGRELYLIDQDEAAIRVRARVGINFA